MTTPNFVRAYPTSERASAPASGLWFVVNRKDNILLERRDGSLSLPLGSAPMASTHVPQLLGYLDGVPCLALDSGIHADTSTTSGNRFVGLRDLYGRVPDSHYVIGGYASQILGWQRVSQFCPSCGARWIQNEGEWGKHCEVCGYGAYPPVSPCVIALVHNGDRLLMTHKEGWGPRFGLVAGFVEPGETLEQCIVREVLEETGVTIHEAKYFASQSWPFPHQIMCGFFAAYASGDINVDKKELDDVRWFSAEDLRTGNPSIPPPISIARQLIDTWLMRHPSCAV